MPAAAARLPGRLGTLGFAFPAAARGGDPRPEPVLCICGDGGFLFAAGELATVAQEAAPLTKLLVDDGGYGMLRYDQLNAGDVPFGVDLTRPDFAALAASFGVDATVVDGFGDKFEHGLRRSLGAGKPHMLVVNAALKPPPTTSPRWYRRRV